MIIYGSRMYGRKNVVNGWRYCDNCGKYGQATSYDGRKWGHLYFIPLIPEGPHTRVVMECKKCSHGTHIPQADVPTMLNDIHLSVDSASAALIAGDKDFDDDGTMTPCVPCLASAVELLYCLGEADYVHLVIATLQQEGLTYAYQLVNGASLAFQGNLQEAGESCRKAAECEPAEPLPLVYLGSVHLKQTDYEGARSVYEKALGLSQDRLPVLEGLLTVYESLKDHAKLAETYEECFQLMPGVTQDKKVVKAYKSACKKAGRQPVQ